VDVAYPPSLISFPVDLGLPPSRLVQFAVGLGCLELPIEYRPRDVTRCVNGDVLWLELTLRETVAQESLPKALELVPRAKALKRIDK
jgi:hypothetical protein